MDKCENMSREPPIRTDISNQRIKLINEKHLSRTERKKERAFPSECVSEYMSKCNVVST